MSQETFTDMTIRDLQKRLNAAEAEAKYWQENYQGNREFLLKLLEIFAVDGKPDRSSMIVDWKQHASDLKHAYSKLAEIEAVEAERDALREENARFRLAMLVCHPDNDPVRNKDSKLWECPYCQNTSVKLIELKHNGDCPWGLYHEALATPAPTSPNDLPGDRRER